MVSDELYDALKQQCANVSEAARLQAQQIEVLKKKIAAWEPFVAKAFKYAYPVDTLSHHG